MYQNQKIVAVNCGLNNTKQIHISNNLPIVLIAGPCQLESRDHAIMIAEKIATICEKIKIQFIFKTSFDKANRTSHNTIRGIGLKAAIPIFEEIKNTIGCPILTDIHDISHPQMLGDSVDILQIPAFLCRQTDLVITAAKSKKIVNIKKGQFLAPWDMQNVVDKIVKYTEKNTPSEDNNSEDNNILLTERGTSFGYNTLVNDMRALPIMAKTGYPVIFDATHSVQQPGGLGGASGGQRDFIGPLVRAAVAVGIAGLFIETHNDPDNAPSDGPCMLPLDKLESVIQKAIDIDNVVKSYTIFPSFQ